MGYDANALWAFAPLRREERHITVHVFGDLAAFSREDIMPHVLEANVAVLDMLERFVAAREPLEAPRTC